MRAGLYAHPSTMLRVTLNLNLYDEKKHPPIHLLRLAALAGLAAHALHHFLPVFWFGTYADCYGKYYPVDSNKKREENIWRNLHRLFHLEHPMYLLGV